MSEIFFETYPEICVHTETLTNMLILTFNKHVRTLPIIKIFCACCLWQWVGLSLEALQIHCELLNLFLEIHYELQVLWLCDDIILVFSCDEHYSDLTLPRQSRCNVVHGLTYLLAGMLVASHPRWQWVPTLDQCFV